MAQPFSVFVNTYNGTSHDVDGAYGAQCWDGYAFYMQWLGYPYAHCTASGGAKDIWDLRASNGMLNSCNVVSSPQNEDIAVWGSNMGGGYGHVAMYYNGKYFGQNQGSSGGSNGGPFNLLAIGTAPLGWFRPKCYADGSGGTVKVQRLRLTLINGIVVGHDYIEVEEKGDI